MWKLLLDFDYPVDYVWLLKIIGENRMLGDSQA